MYNRGLHSQFNGGNGIKGFGDGNSTSDGSGIGGGIGGRGGGGVHSQIPPEYPLDGESGADGYLIVWFIGTEL
jgi:hypothetical protein